MKRILIYLLVFSLLLITCGGAVLSEADLTSTSAEELLQAGKFAEANGNYEKALEYYQLAADQGEEESQCWVAIMYHAGEVVSQDYGKALKYYQLAADQGNAIALNNLGDMYENGNGVDQDYSKALEYYRLAADQGLGDAFIGLGDLYRDGRGVEQDDGKAAEYYGKALELGIDIAEERLNELEAKQ